MLFAYFVSVYAYFVLLYFQSSVRLYLHGTLLLGFTVCLFSFSLSGKVNGQWRSMIAFFEVTSFAIAVAIPGEFQFGSPYHIGVM